MKQPKEKAVPFKTNVEVVLSEAELKQCAKNLAEALNSKSAIETAISAFKAQKKADLSNIQSTIQRNTLLLNTGKEFRLVECEWEYDWKRGMKKGRRKDNGEIIMKETISDEERQLSMETPASQNSEVK